MMAALSVAGVIGGIAFTIYLTQTLLAPLIEKATWFPENGLVGIIAWLLLYVVLALLVAPASLHKFISGVLFGFWGRSPIDPAVPIRSSSWIYSISTPHLDPSLK